MSARVDPHAPLITRLLAGWVGLVFVPIYTIVVM